LLSDFNRNLKECGQILVKIPSVKFNENPFNREQKFGHGEATGRIVTSSYDRSKRKVAEHIFCPEI
jgi:hypothetical protein